MKIIASKAMKISIASCALLTGGCQACGGGPPPYPRTTRKRGAATGRSVESMTAALPSPVTLLNAYIAM